VLQVAAVASDADRHAAARRSITMHHHSFSQHPDFRNPLVFSVGPKHPLSGVS
jgi:hypothetical protein